MAWVACQNSRFRGFRFSAPDDAYRKKVAISRHNACGCNDGLCFLAVLENLPPDPIRIWLIPAAGSPQAPLSWIQKPAFMCPVDVSRANKEIDGMVRAGFPTCFYDDWRQLMALPPGCEKEPPQAVRVPRGYVPPNGTPYTVKKENGKVESFASIAQARGLDPWVLIDFNFKTNKTPTYVNWYLYHHKGCRRVTADGKNYMFSGGETIYLPPTHIDMPEEVITVPAPPMYNRAKAVAYARRWASSPNPAYDEADNDCTNFVSQALLAGGWTQVSRTSDDSDRQEKTVWWYGQRSGWYRGINSSWTWANAQFFHDFLKLSGRGKQVSDPMKLRPGDVVQIKDSSRVHHTMIVSQVVPASGSSPGDLKLCYHTSNELDILLSEVQRRAAGETFIYWQISDTNF